MSNISIGKVIYNILSNDKDLKIKLKDKIFPLVSEAETTFPFLIYRRKSILQHNTKDKLYSESADVEIIIASEKYNESVVLAEMVKEVLEKYKGINNSIDVDKIEVIDAYEEFANDAYLQNLVIKINTNKYGSN